MEKEIKITAPDGCKKTKVYKIAAPNMCEIEKVEIVDGMAVVTFKEKDRKLPKSWEEFCEMFHIKEGECYIHSGNFIEIFTVFAQRERKIRDQNILPDRATAEAVLALCQLIQLRNCYNGDWVPDYKTTDLKFTIKFFNNKIVKNTTKGWPILLSFKTEELCDEFLKNFRPLIEKLKPLYGIKKGGEE